MHQTLNTSLIYFDVYPIHSNSYQNIKTTQKYFSWIFCIFTDICLSVIPFFILHTVQRFVLLLLPQDWIASQGHTYLLIGSARQVGCLSTQALKCWVNKCMRVRQNLCMPSLLGVFTHWGGVVLGSIYSQSSFFTHWGVVLLDNNLSSITQHRWVQHWGRSRSSSSVIHQRHSLTITPSLPRGGKAPHSLWSRTSRFNTGSSPAPAAEFFRGCINCHW